MLYINIENAIYGKANLKSFTLKSPQLRGSMPVSEAGFEYITDIDGAKVFRKRK